MEVGDDIMQSGQTVACPSCGSHQTPAGAAPPPAMGAGVPHHVQPGPPYGAPGSPGMGGMLPVHPQATTVFVLGLIGILITCVGFILGPIAWIKGNGARREIALGRYAESGMLTAGWVMGIIATFLSVGVLVLYAVVFAAAASQGQF